MEEKYTYNIGDIITIVNYGHAIWQHKNSGMPKPNNIIHEDDTKWWFDLRPEIVGKSGRVKDRTITQGVEKYTVEGIGAWFSLNQLQLKEAAII